MDRYLLGCALITLLCGCSTTYVSHPSTLTPFSTPVTTTTTTTIATTTTIFATNFVAGVIDGRTFDMQDRRGTRRYTMTYLDVPDISTCEGLRARNTLSAIIASHDIEIYPDGTVWRNDIDVGLAMINFGVAKANSTSPAYYQRADDISIDFRCK